MGDILDLILDFERKLLGLVRDLVVHPRRVAESIVNKDKKYLGSFKFYSLVTSVWLILFHLGSEYFDFSLEGLPVPERLGLFFRSEQDFGFLIAPFAGLAEFFIPFGILNFAVFRKQSFSLLTHLTLNVYLGALILLYEIPVFIVATIIDTEFGVVSAFVEYLMYTLLIAVPVLYYGSFHVRILSGKKWWILVKSMAVILLVGYFSITQFLEKPFHETIHRKILYSRYEQFDLKPNVPDGLLIYTFAPYGEGAGNVIEFRNQTETAHAFVLYDGTDIVLKSMRPGDSVVTVLNTRPWTELYALQEQDRRMLILRKPWDADSTFLSEVSEGGKVVTKNRLLPNFISARSRLIRHQDKLFFTGHDKNTGLPVIGELTAGGDSVKRKSDLASYNGFLIDDAFFLAPSDSAQVSVLLYNVQKERLRELVWARGSMNVTPFKIEKSHSIYKNEFSPTWDSNLIALHKGAMRQSNDSTAIVAFQLMSDSSFVLNLTSLNTRTGLTNWNKHYTVPSDYFLYDKMLIDSTSVYVFGRAMSFFRKDLSFENYQLPYIQVIDIGEGTLKQTYFLPMEEESRDYAVSFLEGMHWTTTSAFQDQANIYWNVGGENSYTISKESLR